MTAHEKAQALSEEAAQTAREAAGVYARLGDVLARLGEALQELEAETGRCPIHGDTLGVYGCPACNAGKKWADDQRSRPVRPRHEGGR